MAKIILDAGHGGQEPGARYEERKEKDDTLRLTLAVGEILENNGVEVVYTRTEDVYDTPFEKAQIANQEGGDFLISFHRNSSPQPNQYSGVESLVFNMEGEKVTLAENINAQLEQVGFRNLGVKERPGLVILRRSRMPAVLVEAGFINTDADNELFDEQFDAIAQAIADGILQTVGQIPAPADAMQRWTEEGMDADMAGYQDEMIFRNMEHEESKTDERGCVSCEPCTRLYRVQTGAFRNRNYADKQLYQLLAQNYPAFILMEDGFYKVQVGAYRKLENAVRMEQALRTNGYETYITT